MFLWSSLNTKGTYFLRISDRGDVIKKQCDLGNLYCSMAQQKKPNVFRDLRVVSRIQLWLDVSSLLIWKMGVLDRIDLSCSLLWGRYEMINQQKFMEHHFCATGGSKINEQNTSLWSSRKRLALEEESTLGICFRALSLGWGDMHESLKATERQCTLPEGSLSSWMETRFVNTQVSYYEALRSRWIHINTLLIIINYYYYANHHLGSEIVFWWSLLIVSVAWIFIFFQLFSLLVYLHCFISALGDWVSWFCFFSLCFVILFLPLSFPVKSVILIELPTPICWAIWFF